MADLIDRQKAIEAIEKKDDFTNTAIGYALGMAIQAVRDLPSAEPERKTGKWEHPNRCSECGFGVLLSPYMRNLDTGEYTLLYKFCPNCGARMEDEP